jgi:hypothetical protein
MIHGSLQSSTNIHGTTVEKTTTVISTGSDHRRAATVLQGSTPAGGGHGRLQEEATSITSTTDKHCKGGRTTFNNRSKGLRPQLKKTPRYHKE